MPDDDRDGAPGPWGKSGDGRKPPLKSMTSYARDNRS
jgi:hypothetical protein